MVSIRKFIKKAKNSCASCSSPGLKNEPTPILMYVYCHMYLCAPSLFKEWKRSYEERVVGVPYWYFSKIPWRAIMMHLSVILFHAASAYSLLLLTTFTILTLRRMRLLCIMKQVSEKTLVEQAVKNRVSKTVPTVLDSGRQLHHYWTCNHEL